MGATISSPAFPGNGLAHENAVRARKAPNDLWPLGEFSADCPGEDQTIGVDYLPAGQAERAGALTVAIQFGDTDTAVQQLGWTILAVKIWLHKFGCASVFKDVVGTFWCI